MESDTIRPPVYRPGEWVRYTDEDAQPMIGMIRRVDRTWTTVVDGYLEVYIITHPSYTNHRCERNVAQISGRVDVAPQKD